MYAPDSPDQPARPNRQRVIYGKDHEEVMALLATHAVRIVPELIADPVKLVEMVYTLLSMRYLLGEGMHEFRRDGKPLPPAANLMGTMLDSILEKSGIDLQFVYCSTKKN